jgi:hypothetical protein
LNQAILVKLPAGAQGCDHECTMLRRINCDEESWENVFDWAQPRWESWLSSELSAADGAIKFEMDAEDFVSGKLKKLLFK